jgi:hypothetical protein
MADEWARDPDKLEELLHACLERGDIKGVGHVLTLMSHVDPRRMLRLVDELKDALAVARFLGAGRG